MKSLFAFAASLMLILGLAVPASAGGNGAQAMTVTSKNVVLVLQFDPNQPTLCNTPPATVTITYNAVFHFTIHSDGTFSDTGTMTGSIVAVALNPTQPTYSGHLEDWFDDHGVATAFGPNGPLNGTETSQSVMNIQATGTDGSRIDAHSDFKGDFAIVDGNLLPIRLLLAKSTC
jgi:autotransporter adhesin